MFNKRITLLILYLLVCLASYGQSHKYKTEAFSADIYTIELVKNDSKENYPIIYMDRDDYITISFDRISEYSLDRLRYKLKFCNADWTENKQLSEIEFVDGFMDNPIDNYWHSRNTSIDYTHFELNIPNNDVGVLLPGNYVVEVYDLSEEKIMLTACFSALQKKLDIAYKLSSNTDIDTHKEHHQLSLDIVHPHLNIIDPIADIKTYVLQNKQLYSLRELPKPDYISHNKLSYKHNSLLIYEAGNEYRRFETSSSQFNGIGVAEMVYQRPYYNAYLKLDKLRANTHYVYDQDQNGRFYIRNRETNDNKLEADYFATHFTLAADKNLGDIYISGDFTNNEISDRYKMTYDPYDKEYYTDILLKQGLYNYQYISAMGSIYSSKKIEGNYYETENEYAVYIYHRPSGQRYDALVGFLSFSSKNK